MPYNRITLEKADAYSNIENWLHIVEFQIKSLPKHEKMMTFWIAAGEEKQAMLRQSGITIADDFDDKYPIVHQTLMPFAEQQKDFLEVLFMKRQSGESNVEFAERLLREGHKAVMPETVTHEWTAKALRKAYLQQVQSVEVRHRLEMFGDKPLKFLAERQTEIETNLNQLRSPITNPVQRPQFNNPRWKG